MEGESRISRDDKPDVHELSRRGSPFGSNNGFEQVVVENPAVAGKGRERQLHEGAALFRLCLRLDRVHLHACRIVVDVVATEKLAETSGRLRIGTAATRVHH